MVGQRITRDKWARYIASFKPDAGKKVKSMSVNLQGSDFTGTLNVTDLQVQSGNQVTVQMPHSDEILNTLRYNFDEAQNIEATTDSSGRPAIKLGNVQGTHYTNMKNRVFNIVGRGHECLAFPNVYQENYTTELVTSGLDLELYAKEDFDFLRISTNDGTLIPGRIYPFVYTDPDTNVTTDYNNTHPLNFRYSREFYMDGGKAGDKIQLSCSLMMGYIGDTKTFQPGQLALGMAGSRQRLMMAPYGSFRMRIEFYKNEYLNVGETDSNGNPILSPLYMDTGIGYYGTAQFNQIQLNPNHSF